MFLHCSEETTSSIDLFTDSDAIFILNALWSIQGIWFSKHIGVNGDVLFIRSRERNNGSAPPNLDRIRIQP